MLFQGHFFIFGLFIYPDNDVKLRISHNMANFTRYYERYNF